MTDSFVNVWILEGRVLNVKYFNVESKLPLVRAGLIYTPPGYQGSTAVQDYSLLAFILELKPYVVVNHSKIVPHNQ